MSEKNIAIFLFFGYHKIRFRFRNIPDAFLHVFQACFNETELKYPAPNAWAGRVKGEAIFV
jgi:hypothetical protein